MPTTSNDPSLDWDAAFLESVLELLDAQLAGLRATDETDPDRDTSHDYERIEMVCGMGFVACQRYIVAVAARSGLNKAEAFAHGEHVASGITVAEAVNAAANFWKQEGEADGGNEDRPLHWTETGVKPFGRVGRENVLSCVLAELTGPKCRFAGLLVQLMAWRDDLLDRRFSGAPTSHGHPSPAPQRP